MTTQYIDKLVKAYPSIREVWLTEDHLPDLILDYNYCHVTVSTHAIGGLSENDFICAAKLDRP
jgi:pterin-4a-carbinolamine dehydratase